MPPCLGDCNGDRMVTISEIILGVRIALGDRPIDRCPIFGDANGDVTMSQLMQGVMNAEIGCEAAASRRAERRQ